MIDAGEGKNPHKDKNGKDKVYLTFGEQNANASTDTQWLLDVIARSLRGQTVMLEWEMTGGQAPAAPAFLVWQFGIKTSIPYCHTVIDKDRDPDSWVKVRKGKLYVKPSQAIWCDYTLRAGARGWSVTTPPLLESHLKLKPGQLGESWGKAVTPPGLGGAFEVWFANLLGYRLKRDGNKGREKNGAVSGIPALNMAKVKAKSATRRALRKSRRFVRGFQRRAPREAQRVKRAGAKKSKRKARRTSRKRR